MVSTKKALFFLSLLFFEIQNIFAGYLTNNLGGSVGDFNKTFLQNENVLIFIYFLALLIGTFTIFKGALRFSFREKEQFHQKEINVISFMMSIIGTTGLFFLFKGKGTAYIVNLFGGIFGLLIMLIIAIIIMRGFVTWAHTMPEDQKRIRLGIYWIGLFVSFGIVDGYLMFLATKLFDMPSWISVFKNIVEDIFFILVLGLIYFAFVFLGKVFRFGKSIEEKEEEQNPGINELRKLINYTDKEISKLDNYFKATTNFLNHKRVK